MRIRNTGLLLLLVAVPGLIAPLVAHPSAATPDRSEDFQLAVAALEDAKWTQVNREPYYISSRLDVLCSVPFRDAYAAVRKENPHASTYITVFVNRLGRGAMLSPIARPFPEGATIVKAKFESSPALTAAKARSPILYTVMIKRRAGYNPEGGDWEFGVVSGGGKTTEAAGKLANCMSCHKSRRTTDFVFRS